MTTAAQITVRYVGRFPINWAPQHATTESRQFSELRCTDPQFRDFVARSLEETKRDNWLTPTQRATKANLIRAVLDRAEDANSCIEAPLPPHDTSPERVEQSYSYFLKGIIADLAACLVIPWGKGNSKDNLDAQDDEEAGKSDKMRGRDAVDKRAQRVVPQWHGSKCILTGTVKPEGCHILPVRAKHANYDEFWNLMTTFWNVKKPDAAFAVKGKEYQNILPLTQTAHALFDAYHFALRPVAHPETPLTKIFIQVVYLRHPDGQRIAAHWNHQQFGGLFDFRRISHNPHRPHHQTSAQRPYQAEPKIDAYVVQHGDIYELTTDDPDAYPLPNEHFLQVQYAAHTLLSGMRAAGALKDTFSGTPPDDDDDDDAYADATSPYPTVPAHWQELVEEAQDLGILNENAATRWSRAFARQAHQDAKDAAALEAAYLESQLDGDDLLGEPDHEDDTNDHDPVRPDKGKGTPDNGYDLR